MTITFSGWLSHTILLSPQIHIAVRNPKRISSLGLASFAFARHYLRNLVWFLFLALLRCFSSGGSPPYVMDWRMDAWGLLMRVSPFRHLRISGYLLLPAAFRSLSRLSSALSAKASTIRSYQHNQLDLIPREWDNVHTYIALYALVIVNLF